MSIVSRIDQVCDDFRKQCSSKFSDLFDICSVLDNSTIWAENKSQTHAKSEHAELLNVFVLSFYFLAK